MDPLAAPKKAVRCKENGKPMRAMLPRGASCATCRRRKVRCDGVKPDCGQCIKSASMGGALSIGGVVCIYESPPPTSAATAKKAARDLTLPTLPPGAQGSDSNTAGGIKRMVFGGAEEAKHVHAGDGDFEDERDGDYWEAGPAPSASSKRQRTSVSSSTTTSSNNSGAERVTALNAKLPGGIPNLAKDARVDVLNSRINELERIISAKAAASDMLSNTLPPLAQSYLNEPVPIRALSGAVPTGVSRGAGLASYSHHYSPQGGSPLGPIFPPTTNAYPHNTSMGLNSINASSNGTGNSTLLPYPSYSHHQLSYQHQSRSGSASGYYSPPLTLGTGMLGGASNLYSQLGSKLSHLQNEQSDFNQPHVGAVLERKTSRNGFDESATRTSSPTLPPLLSGLEYSNPISATGSPSSTLPSRNYASFIPMPEETYQGSAPGSNQLYPFLSPPNLPTPLTLSSPALTSNSDPSTAPSAPYSQHSQAAYSNYSQSTHSNTGYDEHLKPLPEQGTGQDYLATALDLQNLYQSTSLTRFLANPAARPAYPVTLPPFATLQHLVGIFFKRASVPASIFDKDRLMSAVEAGRFWAESGVPWDGMSYDAFGSTPNEWPEEALLHAICGFACVFVSPEALGVPYWGDEEIPQEDYLGNEKTGVKDKFNYGARAYHFDLAKAQIDKAVAAMGRPGDGARTGRQLFQILQAIIVASYIAYASASFTSLWLLSGTATRLCTPLGLNHLPPWDYINDRLEESGQDWKKIGRSGGFYASGLRRSSNAHTDTATDPGGSNTTLWGPPATRHEHYERTITFWTAFSIDRHSSASTDWSTSIDEQDITTLIPCLGPAPRAALSINHPDFLNEFAKPVNSVGRYVKAVVLLGRVVNCIQRLRKYEDLEFAGGPGRTPSEFMRSVKSTPAFLELDAALGRFRTATSGMLFDKGDHVDGHLASAYVIPHAASILLHEIFSDPEDRSATSSIARCLTSAKCIVNSTYLLYESSNDLSGCDPFLPMCWSIVSRSLVRDHAIKTEWQEYEAASISRNLAEHCLGFTARCQKLRGTPISKLLTANLRAMLDSTATSEYSMHY